MFAVLLSFFADILRQYAKISEVLLAVIANFAILHHLCITIT